MPRGIVMVLSAVGLATIAPALQTNHRTPEERKQMHIDGQDRAISKVHEMIVFALSDLTMTKDKDIVLRDSDGSVKKFIRKGRFGMSRAPSISLFMNKHQIETDGFQMQIAAFAVSSKGAPVNHKKLSIAPMNVQATRGVSKPGFGKNKFKPDQKSGDELTIALRKLLSKHSAKLSNLPRTKEVGKELTCDLRPIKAEKKCLSCHPGIKENQPIGYVAYVYPNIEN